MGCAVVAAIGSGAQYVWISMPSSGRTSLSPLRNVRFGRARDRGQLGDILKACGLVKDKLEKAIEQVRGGNKVEDPEAEEKRQALEKYTIDLTERAERQASIRLSVVMKKSAAPSRCCNVVPRITLCVDR